MTVIPVESENHLRNLAWVEDNGRKVEQDPKLVREGYDPQLEKAVEVLMYALQKNPPPKYTRPPFPNHHRK